MGSGQLDVLDMRRTGHGQVPPPSLARLLPSQRSAQVRDGVRCPDGRLSCWLRSQHSCQGAVYSTLTGRCLQLAGYSSLSQLGCVVHDPFRYDARRVLHRLLNVEDRFGCNFDHSRLELQLR